MAQGIATVTIFGADPDEVTLDDVEFDFIPGENSLYEGADGSQGLLTRAGTLRLKTPPIRHWQAAHLISLSYPNGRESNHALEVTRTFKQPYEQDGWLYFPVIPRRAKPYRE
jgi:hypothetical protein